LFRLLEVVRSIESLFLKGFLLSMEASALLSVADGLRADGRTVTQLR